MLRLSKAFYNAASIGVLAFATSALSNPAQAQFLTFDGDGKVSPGFTLDSNQTQAYRAITDVITKYTSDAGLTKLEKDGNNPAAFQSLKTKLGGLRSEYTEILEAAPPGKHREFTKAALDVQFSFDALTLLSNYQSKTGLMGELKADMTNAFTAKDAMIKGTKFKPVTPAPMQTATTVPAAPQQQATTQSAPVPIQPKQPAIAQTQTTPAPIPLTRQTPAPQQGSALAYNYPSNTPEKLPGIFDPNRNNTFYLMYKKLVELTPANLRDSEGRSAKAYLQSEGARVLNNSYAAAKNNANTADGSCMKDTSETRSVRADSAKLGLYMGYLPAFNAALNAVAQSTGLSPSVIKERMEAIVSDLQASDSGHAPMRFAVCGTLRNGVTPLPR